MSEIKVDTVAEKTSANGVTIDGLNIKDSKLVTANSIVASNITDGVIAAAKLASGVLPTNAAVFSARIGSSGSESLANNTATTIPFGGEEFDPDNVFDASSTYKFTAPSAGKYFFNWCVRKSDFTAARFFIDVFVNNSGVATFEEGSGSVYGSLSGSIIMNLSQNDTVYGQYTQNSGSTKQISRNNSRFSGYKLIT